MMDRISKFVGLYLVLASLTACLDDDVSRCKIPGPSLTEASEIIRESREQITINGTTLVLLAQPSIDPYFEEYNVACSNFLIDVDSIAIPEGIILAEQYVIHDDSVWFAPYTKLNDGWDYGPYVIHQISHGGPKWVAYDSSIDGYDRTVKVIVVARVIDTTTCSEYYLRDDQLIATNGG